MKITIFSMSIAVVLYVIHFYIFYKIKNKAFLKKNWGIGAHIVPLKKYSAKGLAAAKRALLLYTMAKIFMLFALFSVFLK